MSELLQALAFVFRRQGTDRLAALDFKHCVSLDLRWFAPADAKRLVEHAIEEGLLLLEDDTLAPNFDPQAVQVPVTFKPTLQALEEPAPDDVPPPRDPEPEAPDADEDAPQEAEPEAAADGEPDAGDADGEDDATQGDEAPTGPAPLIEAAERSGESLEHLIREAEKERTRRGRLLTPQAAALVIARRHGVDVTPYLEDARAALRPE